MSNSETLTEKLTAIADAIRSKEESSAAIPLDDMPTRIAAIRGETSHIYTTTSTDTPSASLGVVGDVYVVIDSE